MADNERERPQPLGIGAFLFNELRMAIQDVRQKVVEQGWFGRVTTPKPVVEMPFQTLETNRPAESGLIQERGPSFEEMWAPKDRTDQSRERPIEHDIER